jgi:hypothetical protein
MKLKLRLNWRLAIYVVAVLWLFVMWRILVGLDDAGAPDTIFRIGVGVLGESVFP